ncbi:hypothetical protein EK21DRAFT_103841 [Setomelanomma holmii]|uniref:Uncharacterized protein n=1 Tax=Setomelanomma holmii TaxID=210430 RepID=A0A9P4H0Y3_9PLEO|nr:hypothetical protein EK21DRAFT_103841 [Setomelanomma holmii]
MRSFQQVVFFLCALLACAFAQEFEAYDATVYITSTVYRVNTVTKSGSAPSSAANLTSTIPAVHPTSYVVVSSLKPNGTVYSTGTVKPTGSGAKPSAPQFTGAASALAINAYVAAFAAGVGYLLL